MTKNTTLYCRMTEDLKEQVEREAALRGESASVIVREALREYFLQAKETPAPNERPATPPAKSRPKQSKGGSGGRLLVS